MNAQTLPYSKILTVHDMLQSISTIRNFDPAVTLPLIAPIRLMGRLLITGEGSSRIFPAKNAIRRALTAGIDLPIHTECARQSALYDLNKTAIMCSSNSGRTREVIDLIDQLQSEGHSAIFGLTAHRDSPLSQRCNATMVTTCGYEKSIPATKSVIEQALICESLVWHLAGLSPDLDAIANSVETALTGTIDKSIVDLVAAAPTIYFAGYNDGVAEELTLKANEMAQRKADFLEGTYVVHGVEEIITPADVVVLVEPLACELSKYADVLTKSIGCSVVAIASAPTPFPTIVVPDVDVYTSYAYLGAGWNLLLEAAISRGVNPDKPKRVRKVGNEWNAG